MSISKYLNPRTLGWWISSPVDTIFEHFADNVVHKDDPKKHHIFINRNSSILVVAHVDHVNDIDPDPNWDDTLILARNLDDRLGCALAFNGPEYGLHADVLLTDHEEIGASTAAYFKTDKKYKWVVEFDRAGDDYVTYYLDSDEWNTELKAHGLKKGHGSYSDICKLDLGYKPCMLNLGIGYHKHHTPASYCEVGELNANMDKLMAFYKANKDKAYEDDGKRWTMPSYNSYVTFTSPTSTPKLPTIDSSIIWRCTTCEVVLFNHQVVGNSDSCTVCGGAVDDITENILNKEEIA